MISDEQIAKYINAYYFECEITQLESQLLSLLKLWQEKYPSEKNDANWLSFSDWVINRQKNESVTK